jgi:hypothetical protein
MSTQISFLTPVIAGIVVGITSMVTFIIGRLTDKMSAMEASAELGGGLGAASGIFSEGIPTYFFQIMVGVYVIQIIYILTTLSNGIENGSDKLGERFALGKNIIKGTLLYSFVAVVVMLIFNIIASSILGATITT